MVMLRRPISRPSIPSIRRPPVAARYDLGNDGPTAGDYTTIYSMDLMGNRQTKSTDNYDDGNLNGDADESITYTYDANDRLRTETKDDLLDDAQDRHTTYDYGPTNAWTAQSEKTVHDGLSDAGTVLEQHSFEYNLQGRVSKTTVTKDGTTTITTYSYDDNGLRVTETTGGETKEYLFDPRNPTGYAQVLEEYVNDQLKQTYTLGHDVIAQHDATNGNLILLYDAHGSTRALLDANGAVVAGQRFTYDAYGNAIGFDETAALTTLLYSGEWTDQRLGVQWLGHGERLYAMDVGRFTQMDRFAGIASSPLTLHKYLYAHGNPVMGTDPTGMFTSVTTSTAVATSFSMRVAINAYVALEVYQVYQGLQSQLKLQRTATRLGTEVISKTEIRTDGLLNFLHGSSTMVWLDQTEIDPYAGRGDFGTGYYTFPAWDPRGFWKAGGRARQTVDRRGGYPFIIVTGTSTSNWKSMSKWNLNKVSQSKYKKVVNGFRSSGGHGLTGYDVVIGPVAVRKGKPPIWTPAPASSGFPSQYKFEAGGVFRLRIVGILPVPPEVYRA